MSEYGEVYRQTTDNGKATVVVRKIWQARKGDSFHVRVLKGKGTARMEKKPGQVLFSDDKKSLADAKKSAEQWLSSDKAKPVLAGGGSAKAPRKGSKAKTSAAYEDAKKRAAAQVRAKLANKAKDNPVKSKTTKKASKGKGKATPAQLAALAKGRAARAAKKASTEKGSSKEPTLQQQFKMLSEHEPRIAETRGIYVVEVFSPFVGKYIPQGEHKSEAEANKDLKTWNADHKRVLAKLRRDLKKEGKPIPKVKSAPPKKTYVCKTKSPVKKGKLDAATRKKIPPVLFALPATKDLPLHDYGHTRSAMGRLNMMYKKGTVTDDQYREAWTNIKAACECFGIEMRKPPLVPMDGTSTKKPAAKKATKKPAAKKATKKPAAKKATKKPAAKKATKKPAAKKATKKPAAKKATKKPAAKKKLESRLRSRKSTTKSSGVEAVVHNKNGKITTKKLPTVAAARKYLGPMAKRGLHVQIRDPQGNIVHDWAPSRPPAPKPAAKKVKKVKLVTGRSGALPAGFGLMKAYEVLAGLSLLDASGKSHEVESSSRGARTTFHFTDGTESTVAHESLVRATKGKPSSKKASPPKPVKVQLWTGTSTKPPKGFALASASEVQPSLVVLDKSGMPHQVESVERGARTILRFADGGYANVGHNTKVRVELATPSSVRRKISAAEKARKTRAAAKKKPAKVKATKAPKRKASKRPPSARRRPVDAKVAGAENMRARFAARRKASLQTLKEAWIEQYTLPAGASQSKVDRVSAKLAKAMDRALDSKATSDEINAAMNEALVESRKPKARKPPTKKPRKAAPKSKTRKPPAKSAKARKAPKAKKPAKAPKARIARVFIDQPDAMAILTTLEGRTWARRQERDRLEVRGFYSNLEAYRHLDDAGLSDVSDVTLSDILPGAGEIDGEKGSVYFVHPNGEVTLQYGSVNAPKRERAQNLGMRVEHGEKTNPIEDNDDDLDIQLETGALISESRDGYAIAVENEYIDSADSIEASLEILRDWMQEHNFWPDVYYVNERGNVDQLDVATGKTLRSWV